MVSKGIRWVGTLFGDTVFGAGFGAPPSVSKFVALRDGLGGAVDHAVHM
jgi:hypothetical protein